ncbi:SDR family NAD(P)-dependent oxidoreductase [Sulfidibacter corallicola]|uniref:SDR family NAD(P)-dependent oxidoreductase n=1 Tax=Sulfidibacter corallicola TaxID=2818388 RepID=A0A8A4TMG2_SULCO|nr:SDR family NAD(P)-dependent oxidoreductase [Sulfidibacter corallicola]QTD50394.1 SDR family NAD(P)-dependent oxidoreductase [Sulfidibacter corallicola]
MGNDRAFRLKHWAIVTGAGSGIGQSLTWSLSKLGIHVLGVGRRMEPLEKTRAADPEHIHVVAADVGSEEGRRAVVDAFPADRTLAMLVHNAAVLEPVALLKDVRLEDWRYHMAVNLDGPMFLSQALLPRMTRGSRILHVSSGAGHNAYHGWGAYCTSKAALNMIWRCLDKEIRDQGIRVGSVRPGVVDTPMQDVVRTADRDVFPTLQRFLDLKEHNQLQQPEFVAKFLSWLLLDVDDDAYAEKEWDVRDAEHHDYWERQP